MIRSYLLWKSKPEGCQLYLESRTCSTEKARTLHAAESLFGLSWGREYPLGPAQHGRGARLLAGLIWEDNELNKARTIAEVYLRSEWCIFSHLVT